MFCNICKKYKYPIFLICKKFYCSNHSRLLYNEIIVIIQKIYRGYKVRRILNNIYIKLPRDLQTHILSFNSIKTINNSEAYKLKIKEVLCKATLKIDDLHNISNNKITLREINEILITLIKYKTHITSGWFNYYKYYFNNIYSILLILCEVHDLPYSFTHIVSTINNDIYESLDFITNSSNNESNDFTKEAKEIMLKINNFLGDSKRTILVI